MLYGLLHCEGFDSEKAMVFYRVIDPRCNNIITITDRDLKQAMNFLIIGATLVEEIIMEIQQDPAKQVDYAQFARKIDRYRPTLEGILEDFEDCIFG